MSYQFAGYGNPVDGWCSRPRKMVDLHTGSHYEGRCGSARPSRCEFCAGIKRGDIASIGRSGWTDHPLDRAYWCTLTAPGSDVLPWDRSLCRHSADVQCSGRDHGCQVEAGPLARWHHGLGLRWSHFVHDVRRLLNPGAEGPVSSWPVQVEFMKTYEPQHRGALHLHPMMRVSGPCSDRRFRAAFKLAASRHGFGKQLVCQQVDISSAEQAARKAGYIAKYSTKCADALPLVRTIDGNGEIGHGGLRSWSASRGWGDTMKTIQQRRCTWAAQAAASGRRDAPADLTAGVDGGAVLDSNQEIYASETGRAPVCPVSSSALLV